MGGEPSLSPSEAHDYLEKLVDSLRRLDRHDKQPLLDTLNYVSQSIRLVRSEFHALRLPGSNAEPGFGSAADELREVVAETGRAADTIMSAAETVQQLAASAAGPERAQFLSAVARIYEACAFQDITGQRVTKVVSALQRMETHIQSLAQACGYEAEAHVAVASDPNALDGPQLAANAQSQADIDRLFAN